MNTYIYDKIILPLETSIKDASCSGAISYSSIHHSARKAREEMGLGAELRAAMLPYYRKLILADKSLFLSKDHGHAIRESIRICMEDEGYDIGSYFDDLDLVTCASHWGEQLCLYKNRSASEFARLVQILFLSNYRPDKELLYQEICKLLSKAKQYGHYKQEEMYCIIMAHLLVSRADLTAEQRAYYYKQITNEWEFLKYMYSIMLNRIIGMRHKNFAGVAHSLSTTTWLAPHLHLAYKAFKNKFATLCPEGEIDHFKGQQVSVQAKMHLMEMEKVIKSTPYSEELTPLCKILFPKKMSEVLGEERPKTYAELEDDINSLTLSYEKMAKKMDDTAQKMADMVKTSVSIKEIEDAFAKFPLQLAMLFYNSINSLLIGNETWQAYAPIIQQHILDRQEKTSATTINNTYMENSCQFQAGSSMNGDVKMGKGNENDK